MSDPKKEAMARWVIKRAIHERDGINSLGRDPLGRLCSCNICQFEREQDDKAMA
jgi:hypothetical protein